LRPFCALGLGRHETAGHGRTAPAAMSQGRLQSVMLAWYRPAAT
jgi:hypothetical protein